MSKKYTLEEVSNIIKSRGYTLLSTEYFGVSKNINILCEKHGIFSMKFANFKNGNQNCPKCSRKSSRYTLEEVKTIVSDRGYSLISTEYHSNRKKIKIKCNLHGTFRTTLDNFKTSKSNGCLGCAKIYLYNKDRKTPTDIIVNFFEKNNYKVISGEYKDNKSKLTVKCPKNHIYKVRFNDFQQGHRCSICPTVTSKPQQEIIDFVKSIYNKEIIINCRDQIHPMELDIYIPEFKLGIELDGLYWHSDKVKKNTKSSNEKKVLLCEQNSINLLCFFEDEWINKKDLCMNMIKYRIGLLTKNKLRASKLELRKLNQNKEFQLFFDKYHLDGHTLSSFAYGLFYDNKLISCASFRKSFVDKKWEIARFATNYNYIVHGALGKILKKFNAEYGKDVISYSNNRLSTGNIYKTLGFKEITKTTAPSYYYTDFKTRLWRFKCKRINDPIILSKYPTEKKQALAGLFSKKYLNHSKPLYKIYDYGHKKWLLNTE